MGHAGEPERGLERLLSTRRSSPRSRHGGTGASKANIRTFIFDGLVDEADLRWRSPQCLYAGGRRRQFGGFSGNSAACAEGARKQTRLVGVPAPPSRPRPQRRAAHHLRRLPRLDGECRGISARRSVAALHGSFLSEHLQRHVPATRVRGVDHMLKAIHAQENRDAADRKARTIVEDLRAPPRCTRPPIWSSVACPKTLACLTLPRHPLAKIHTNNPFERIMKEIHQQTRVVGAFPDGPSCFNLAAARRRYIAGTAWSAKCYMNMRPLYQPQVPQTEAVA